MIIENITVTATPTTIAQLVATARSATLGTQMKGIVGDLTVRYDLATSTVIWAEEVESVAPVELLHGDTEGIRLVTLEDIDLTKILLSVSTGTQVIEIIFNRGVIV